MSAGSRVASRAFVFVPTEVAYCYTHTVLPVTNTPKQLLHSGTLPLHIGQKRHSVRASSLLRANTYILLFFCTATAGSSIVGTSLAGTTYSRHNAMRGATAGGLSVSSALALAKYYPKHGPPPPLPIDDGGKTVARGTFRYSAALLLCCPAALASAPLQTVPCPLRRPPGGEYVVVAPRPGLKQAWRSPRTMPEARAVHPNREISPRLAAAVLTSMSSLRTSFVVQPGRSLDGAPMLPRIAPMQHPLHAF